MSRKHRTGGRFRLTRPGITSERSVALFLLGLIAFNPPILSIFSVESLVLGLPLLYLYLFAGWAVLILLAWLTAERGEEPEPAAQGPPDPPPERRGP